jgi:hypothetical protein
MALLNAITTGVQSPTTAGAITGSLDTSALTGKWSLKIRIAALGAGKTAIIAIEDTASATPFNDAIAQTVIQVKGTITEGRSEKNFVIHDYELPGVRFGVANAKLRANLLAVTATPGLKVQIWLEQ